VFPEPNVTISIANRILLGFAVVVILTIGLGAYTLRQLDDVRSANEVVVTRDITILRSLERLRAEQNGMNSLREQTLTRFFLQSLGQQQAGLQDAVAAWNRQAASAEAATAQASTLLANMRASAITSLRADAWRDTARLLEDAAAELRQMRSATERQFAAIQSNDLSTVLASETTIANSGANWLRILSEADKVLDSAIATGQRRVTDIYEESRTSILIALIGVAVVSFVITYAIRSSIIGPLSAFMNFVENVGQGNLAGQTAATGRDEIGRLGVTLNTMVEGLRQLARQSREATENLNASAAEIRASTQEQAASVEEQLAAVQETAATVDEITHAGAQIGKRAQEVIAAAQATAQTSSAGLHAVEETARAMDAIREQAEAVAENIVALSEKTQAVGEIIATVNDVSERSHLLALNAAIEAAAAGESGRSFAVVASEMKVLADQAKEATVQVRSILGDIQRGINSSVMLTEEAVKRVVAGKERTDITQQTITEISGRVQESVQTFQQIVASTNQQQLGIEQVMGALQNIRQASQQTAAGTRQLDTAAATLSDLSQQLLALAERYRL
jgi:methyl-accepting chemotaxis protein